MLSPLRSNGDTEAGRPARGRIYRLDGSLGGRCGRTGAGMPSGRAYTAPGRPACPPPQADGQGRRCPRHGPGPDARTDGPRHTHRHTGHTPQPDPGRNPAGALCGEEPQPESRTARRTAPPTTPRGCPHPLCSPRPPAAGRRESCGHAGGGKRGRRRTAGHTAAGGCRTLAVEDSVFVRPPAGAVVGPPRLTRSPGHLPRPARTCAFRRPRQHAAAAPGVLRRIGQTRVPEGHLPFRDAGESAGPWPAPAGVRLSSPGPPAAGSCRGPHGVCGRRPGGPPPADRR